MNKEIKLLDRDAVKFNFGTGISHPCCGDNAFLKQFFSNALRQNYFYYDNIATSPLMPVLS